MIWNPEDLIGSQIWRELQLQSLEVRRPSDFDNVFDGAMRARVGGLAIMPSPLLVTNVQRIADFAVKNRLPSIFHLKEFVERGGLAAYGPDRSDLYRRAATFVDKILKGAKPATLPVEQPTKFELVINLKTAKAIGITIPRPILARADGIIE